MPAVIDVLRRFLPRFLATRPILSAAQRRAIRAIQQCRTPAMGGHLHACPDCSGLRFAWHSCNHKACPQCGRAATALWVERQLAKLAGAPYFLVTFTLPQQLRPLFFGKGARQAYDAFFAAASKALADRLASRRALGATISGATAVLHTWTQQLFFHPHLHFIVPGAGLDEQGSLRRVRNDNFLVVLPVLQRAFKAAFRRQLRAIPPERRPRIDPALWNIDWVIDIEPCGTGAAAVKYLGAYVARTAIGDSRIVRVEEDHILIRWKDRSQGGRERLLPLDPVEFVRRYLRHVLPPRMHSIRHFGFCHPAAKRARERVRFLSGMPIILENAPAPKTPPRPKATPWSCPCCGAAMQLRAKIGRAMLSLMPRLEDDS